MMFVDRRVNSIKGYALATIPLLLIFLILMPGKHDTLTSTDIIKMESSAEVGKLVERDVDWRSVAIDGAVTAFVATFVNAGGILMNGCGPAITDRFHLTTDAYQGDNERACYAALAAYAMLGWGGIILGMYGKGKGWIFDNTTYKTQDKRDLHQTLPVDGTIMLEIAPGISIDISNMRDDYVDEILSHHQSPHHDAVSFTSRLYSGKSSDEIETIGYLFAFTNYVANATYTVATDLDGLTGASEALSRFNGVDQVYDSSAILTNSSSYRNQKRSSGGMWASFTGWGGDTGYINDLISWNEYYNAGPAFYAIGDNLIHNLDGCSNSVYCFAADSKMCAAIGFSSNRGSDDAEVGEVYLLSYGGLDNDCVYG